MDLNTVMGISSLVTAAATFVYTIGTFLLWHSTRKAVNSTRDAFKLNFLLAQLQIEQHASSAKTTGSHVIDRIVANRRRDEAIELLRRVFPDEYELILGKREGGTEEQKTSAD